LFFNNSTSFTEKQILENTDSNAEKDKVPSDRSGKIGRINQKMIVKEVPDYRNTSFIFPSLIPPRMAGRMNRMIIKRQAILR